MKRILEIGIYKSGDLASEVLALNDVNAHVEGDRAVFTGHVTIKSRFKERDFSGFYQLTKVYLKHEEKWQVVASRTARLSEDSTQRPSHLHQ
jgi:ketosteroid isomerase-like protein